ncbi:TIGR00730 family Rossman fold protein [Silvanigrella aquatica]|uniref:Cytokinin riboside 5'-monophosphate phosphoribohydrolase n=1 Tax=Silvanigrella aquatica TaxID=1915309 RepID=A0A1L4D354_9BACT|nr:TIGR00730 family Rossman fold protein [Silvanigrella aquatica]APJ04636.1 Rossman fold protein, TIGR00730 family [Silvanigrella aquatica]
MKRIAVFCGSNFGNKTIYRDVAKELGCLMAHRGISLVYGGGKVGLMGEIADSVLAQKGEVIGVMPQFLVDKEVAHKGLSELHVVQTMHDRKALMADLSSGFVALPGGFGTVEEFFEMITCLQLGLHKKPCAVLNVDGYFDSLFHFVDYSVTEGFIRLENSNLIIRENNPELLLDKMKNFKTNHVDKWI